MLSNSLAQASDGTCRLITRPHPNTAQSLSSPHRYRAGIRQTADGRTEGRAHSRLRALISRSPAGRDRRLAGMTVAAELKSSKQYRSQKVAAGELHLTALGGRPGPADAISTVLPSFPRNRHLQGTGADHTIERNIANAAPARARTFWLFRRSLSNARALDAIRDYRSRLRELSRRRGHCQVAPSRNRLLASGSIHPSVSRSMSRQSAWIVGAAIKSTP